MFKRKSYYYLISLILFYNCSGNSDSEAVTQFEGVLRPPEVDVSTPIFAKPFINISSDEFELKFSDEFNDASINTDKWNVQEDFSRDRGEFILYSDKNQIEEKDGHLFIYYQKDKTRDKAYLAGRIDSKGKYFISSGFLEAKIHFVVPNGHQTAFWMMPEGNGMKVPDGVNGNARDGAEIDIIEANKTNTFSCGLHWDGYGADHKHNGRNIRINGMHEQEYHIIGFDWTEDSLSWYFNGEKVREITDSELIPQVNQYIYFSGSMWAENDWVVGNVLHNEFIQNGGIDKAYIDYIRVYQKK